MADIIEFLNAEQVRATYGAVSELLGIVPRSLGAVLGDRRHEVSWIVNKETGLPTAYTSSEMHPALFGKSEVISSGRELALKMSAWKARRV